MRIQDTKEQERVENMKLRTWFSLTGVYLCWDLNIRNVEPNAVKMMVRQYTAAETVGLKTTVLDAFLLLVFSPNPI